MLASLEKMLEEGVRVVELKIMRRKKDGRSLQEISPSMYDSAKPMSLEKRMRVHAEGEWM